LHLLTFLEETTSFFARAVEAKAAGEAQQPQLKNLTKKLQLNSRDDVPPRDAMLRRRPERARLDVVR
jgi:hypothetical protein